MTFQCQLSRLHTFKNTMILKHYIKNTMILEQYIKKHNDLKTLYQKTQHNDQKTQLF